MKKVLFIVTIIGVLLVVGGGLVLKYVQPDQSQNSPSPTSTTFILVSPKVVMNLGQQPTTLPTSGGPCSGWSSQSDYNELLIKLNFAEGVVKDTSYETGFAFSPILRTARLARKEEYCTGFSYKEMMNKGVVQVAVWGYSDNRRRQLANEPINITFDENGKPNIDGIIEVTVLD